MVALYPCPPAILSQHGGRAPLSVLFSTTDQLLQTPAAAGNICVNGGCVCPANQYECYNKCTDVMTDNMNCGYCGNVCPGE